MNARQKVLEMLDEFDTAMLVTRSGDGRLEARPMMLLEVEPDGEVWLMTSWQSQKADEIQQHPDLLLVCHDGTKQSLSLRGHGRVVQDPARVRRLWKEPHRVWFPNGPDDPDIAMIAITPDSAEFWDTSGTNRLEYIWEAAKAYATGQRADQAGSGDKHGETRL